MAQWLPRTSSTAKVQVCFPEGQNIYKLGNSDVVNIFVKTNGGRDRRPDFDIFVIWSVSYILAESVEHKESISSSSFYGQSADYHLHIFSLIHPVDEFSFWEMRTWGQPMISSCSLCVRCES